MPPDVREQTRAMTVRALTLEAEGVLSVLLTPVDGVETPAWESGAHVDVVVHDGTTRQYSLCGAPTERRDFRIAVLHEPGGRGGSSWFHGTVRPGDVLDLRGPRNHFRLEQAPGYVFVAGGIGITPILPMLAEADRDGADWQLFYFGRTRDAMAFLPDLETYGDRVRVLAKDEHHGEDLGMLLGKSPTDHLVYVCGPPRMTGEVTAVLDERGEAGRLRTEYFSAPVAAATDPGVFTVRLERQGVELAVPADRSVLDVVRGAGADILSDCEEGICGSCETTVLAGEVEHRDWVLTTQEKQQNRCMMICVSRAASGRLVLDL